MGKTINGDICDILFKISNKSPYYSTLIRDASDLRQLRENTILSDAILSEQYRYILNSDFAEGKDKRLYGNRVSRSGYDYIVYWSYNDLQKLNKILAAHRYDTYKIKCTSKRCVTHGGLNDYNPRHIIDNIYISHDSREISFF